MCSKVGLTLTVVKLNNVQEHRLQGCSGAPNVDQMVKLVSKMQCRRKRIIIYEDLNSANFHLYWHLKRVESAIIYGERIQLLDDVVIIYATTGFTFIF